MNFVDELNLANFIIVNVMQLNWGLHMYIIIIVNFETHKVVD